MKTINDVAAILSNRRKELNLEQSDMYMRIGMKQQQYQRVEAGNDVRLSTFLRILEGLDLEMDLHPIGRNEPPPHVQKQLKTAMTISIFG